MATDASMVFDTGRGSPGCSSYEPVRRSLKSITLRSGKNALAEAKRIAGETPTTIKVLEESAHDKQEVQKLIEVRKDDVKKADEAIKAAEQAAPPPAPPVQPASSALDAAPPPPAPPNPLLERLRKNRADAEEAQRKEEERLAQIEERQKQAQVAFDDNFKVAREIVKATGDEQ